MRVHFKVSFDLPLNATVQECEDYVRDAVTIWRGSLRPAGSIDETDPGDPLWDLDTRSIVVKRFGQSSRSEFGKIRSLETAARNQRIIDDYTADPKANSSVKLAERYGLSRERICQILRPVNAIATAQERRETARLANAAARERIKEETLAAWEARLAEALEHVRAGKSIRQAARLVGMLSSSHFTNTLNKRVKLEGIPVILGPHRDFSQRKIWVKELVDQGNSAHRAVAILRASKDPTLNYSWIAGHMPEVIKRRK